MLFWFPWIQGGLVARGLSWQKDSGVGDLYQVAVSEGVSHVPFYCSSWRGTRVPKDTPKSHALTFEILRDNLNLFVCSLSPEETLNSKQASFPDTERVLKGVLHAFHGLPGKQYEAWKSWCSLLIPFVFKENGGVLFCCLFFFFHGNAKEPSQQKKVYQCFPTAITVVGVCLSCSL